MPRQLIEKWGEIKNGSKNMEWIVWNGFLKEREFYQVTLFRLGNFKSPYFFKNDSEKGIIPTHIYPATDSLGNPSREEYECHLFFGEYLQEIPIDNYLKSPLLLKIASLYNRCW